MMQRRSSNMQKAIFLNKDKVIKRLTKLAAKAIAKDKNIKKVVLFGSLVDDTYTSMSDADLLVILRDSNQRFMDRIPELIFYFIDAPVVADVFPYTENEVKSIPFAKKAISKGIILAEA